MAASGELTWTRPLSEVLSMREAVFTVSPTRHQRGLVRPRMPATSGPQWMPTRSCSATPSGDLCVEAAASMSRAMCAMRRACSRGSAGSGVPATHMYASPMVSTFCTPWRAAISSKESNMPASMDMRRPGAVACASDV